MCERVIHARTRHREPGTPVPKANIHVSVVVLRTRFRPGSLCRPATEPRANRCPGTLWPPHGPGPTPAPAQSSVHLSVLTVGTTRPTRTKHDGSGPRSCLSHGWEAWRQEMCLVCVLCSHPSAVPEFWRLQHPAPVRVRLCSPVTGSLLGACSRGPRNALALQLEDTWRRSFWRFQAGTCVTRNRGLNPCQTPTVSPAAPRAGASLFQVRGRATKPAKERSRPVHRLALTSSGARDTRDGEKRPARAPACAAPRLTREHRGPCSSPQGQPCRP